MMRRYWSGAEDALLRRHWEDGKSVPQIADLLNRTDDSVRARRVEIGLPISRRASTDWPTEQTERMLELHAKGYSAGQIGQQMGISRNAVLGKLHRLGHSKPRSKPRPKRTPAPRPPYRDLDPTLRARRRPPPQAIAPPGIAIEFPRRSHTTGESGPKPLMVKAIDIEAGRCRYPFGDPKGTDFGFCGHPVVGEGSYCSHHHKLVYIPLRQATSSEQRAGRYPGSEAA